MTARKPAPPGARDPRTEKIVAMVSGSERSMAEQLAAKLGYSSPGVLLRALLRLLAVLVGHPVGQGCRCTDEERARATAELEPIRAALGLEEPWSAKAFFAGITVGGPLREFVTVKVFQPLYFGPSPEDDAVFEGSGDWRWLAIAGSFGELGPGRNLRKSGCAKDPAEAKKQAWVAAEGIVAELEAEGQP